MKKFSWQGILAFTVTAIAIGTVVSGALRVIGADCDSDGLWTMGVRAAAVNVTTEAQLQGAVNSRQPLINIMNDISLSPSASIDFSAAGTADIEIQGNGHTLTGGGESVILYDQISNSESLNVTIKNLTITGGTSTSTMGGGGILWRYAMPSGSGSTTLTLENCKVVNNMSLSGGGGGIAFDSVPPESSLIIINSEISGNTANSGSGIEIQKLGNININDSTIAYNTATGYGAGGVYQSGKSNLKISNSTVYSNISDNGYGGIGADGNNAQTEINFCTITKNEGSSLGGGIFSGPAATLAIFNSIVAGNVGPECAVDSSGTTESVTMYNVLGTSGVSNFTPGATNVTDKTAAEIFGSNTLQENVQGTPTVALAEGSPAINLIPSSEMTAFTNDQRGLPRPGKYKTALLSGDAGAFESGNTAPIPPTPPTPPTKKEPITLSSLVLNLGRNGTGVLFAVAPGTWSADDTGMIGLSSSPFTGSAISNISGSVCYVKSLGKAGETTIRYENDTHKGSLKVRVADMDITQTGIDKLRDMNNGLLNSGVGIALGGNVSGDLDGLGTIVENIVSMDATVDTNAPKMLCYTETGKGSGLLQVEVPKDGKNYMLPMQYMFSFKEEEIKKLSESVERNADIDKIFGTDKAAAVEEFFSVFVLQKEIKQGNRKGQLARLMGGAEKQARIISPSDALSAGILRMSNDNKVLFLEFDFCVIDGAQTPAYNEQHKMLVIGDGEKDGLIVDPLWANMRSEATNTVVDGGSGCTTASSTAAPSIAGLGIFILLFPLLILRRKRKS